MRKRLFSLLLAVLILFGQVVEVSAASEDIPAKSGVWRDGVFRDGVYEGYYAQLDDLQKILYDKLKEAFAKPVREAVIRFDEPVLLEEEGGCFTGDDLKRWMNDYINNDRGGRYAVFRDHPELPWLLAVDYKTEAIGKYVYNAQGDCTGFRMTGIYYENTYPWVVPEAYTNPSALEKAADDAARAIGKARPSRAATVRAIHDYLCRLISYEERVETLPDKHGGSPHTVYYDQTSYNALVPPNRSVCNGYSAAFKLLCDRYGIPCVHLSGMVFFLNGEKGNHAWNYVQMEDGSWYAVDPTWGDGEPVSYDHFLVGKNTKNSAGVTFADMHETPPYNNYLPAAPVLSDTACPYMEATLDMDIRSVDMGGCVQLQLSGIRDLDGNTAANLRAGLFEEDAKDPVATGVIREGSVTLNYDTAKSGLGAGRHNIYVRCMDGAQKGAVLAAVEIMLKAAGPFIPESELVRLAADFPGFRQMPGR